MKQSLIITAIICLALGQSFSVISRKEKALPNKPAYCCTKPAGQLKSNEAKKYTEPDPATTMVNILGYN